MTTDETVAYYGSKQALGKALGIKNPRDATKKWGERPRMLRQYQIEILTRGRLRADDYATRAALYSPQR